MPLILRKDITPEITLGIWHIDENIETLLPLCLPDDRREAAKFVNESRKIEWLAWHALLQALHPGAKASYDPQGGPILDVNLHIGVSHTRNYAAVILAPTPCAIDIENIERDFSRALPRYTTPQEQLIGTALPNPQLYPALFGVRKRRFTNSSAIRVSISYKICTLMQPILIIKQYRLVLMQPNTCYTIWNKAHCVVSMRGNSDKVTNSIPEQKALY